MPVMTKFDLKMRKSVWKMSIFSKNFEYVKILPSKHKRRINKNSGQDFTEVGYGDFYLGCLLTNMNDPETRQSVEPLARFTNWHKCQLENPTTSIPHICHFFTHFET